MKDFRTLATNKYMDKYMLWALVVLAAVDSGWKVAREGGGGCCHS